MTEYNVYIVDLDADRDIYLYTTLSESIECIPEDPHVEFYRQEFGINRSAFHVIPTADDDRSRDELIFDYIIEEDDSTSTTSSE